MIDSTDCASGDGPMAPTRAGVIPATDIIRLCYSNRYTENDLKRKCTENGGLVDHIQTFDLREVKEKIKQGDEYSRLLYNSMAYQVGKYISAYGPVVAKPGEEELIALAMGALRVLQGKDEAKTYTGKPVWDKSELEG